MMMLFSLMMLFGVGEAQLSGITKATFACSDAAATTAYDWLITYLPVVEAFDDCENRTCTCGKQSRVETTTGFGIHCVYAAGVDATRYDANGGTTPETIAAAYAAAIGDWSSYDTAATTRAFTDYAVGLWASAGLDSYVEAFTAGGVAHRVSTWTYFGTEYYAATVLVPDTPVVLELLGTCSVCVGKHRELRVVPPTEVSGSLTPIFVSRSVSNLTAVQEYYDKVFGVWGEEYESEDATIIDYELYGATTIIRYASRKNQTGFYTTNWLRERLLGAAREYQTSPSACWPVHGDFHYAYDGTYEILPVVTAAGLLGYPYRSFVNNYNDADPSNVYLLEPSGMWIQLDGTSDGMYPYGGFDDEYCYTFCENVRSSPAFFLAG